MTDPAALSLSLDTVWIVLCAILVFFMQAGFAMLEAGLVRAKNAVNVIMKNYIDVSLGSIGFFLLGFGVMFGANPSGFVGTDSFAPTMLAPEGYTFLFFQMMFAATAATIVSGALAERIRYLPYVVAAVAITSLIYPVFGSWAWGGWSDGSSGWLAALGFVDFAGSSVVHAVGGWCALAGIVVLGARMGRFSAGGAIPGHNLPMAALGAFILWTGFFAFNAGSTLGADASLGAIVLNTHLAGVAGVAVATVLLALLGRPLLLGHVINGGLGGLVAICAGADAVGPLAALAIGAVAGAVVVFGSDLLERLRLDDAVGAVPVHAFAGTWGTLAVAIFMPGGGLGQLGVQVLGVTAAFLWVFPLALGVFKLLDVLMSLRVSTGQERRGLDFSEHAEVGYPEFQRELLHRGRSAAPIAPDATSEIAA